MKRLTGHLALFLCLAVMVGACSGGGGGGTTPTDTSTVTVKGTAATGSPIANATITIRDSKGNVTTTTTGADGTYSVDLTGTAPWILQIPKPGSGTMLYSYANAAGTVNIHPLTDPIIRSWFKVQGANIDTVFSNYGTSSVPTPSASELEVIKNVVQEVVKDLMVAAGAPLNFDLLSGTFSADGTGFDKVLHDTTINYTGMVISVTVTPGSALDTAVSASGGSSTASIDTSAISLAADITPPGKPAGLSAVAVSSTQVLLTWSAPADSDVVGYKIYQAGKADAIATVTSTVYIVPGLSPSTSYSFTAKAFDAAKNLSVASDPASVTTIASTSDSTAPSAPSGLAATPLNDSSIKLAWTASTDNIGVVEYKIRRDNVLIAKVPGTTFIIAGLAAGTTYNFTVTAIDAAGNESSAAATTATTSSADTAPPAAPTGLTANALSSSQIRLSWTANAESDLAGYFVFRGTTKIAILTLTAYTDSGLTASTNYCYTVRAFDKAGNVSAASTEACSTTSSTVTDVTSLVAAAKAALEAQDMGLARAKFFEAYGADPTNKDAAVGAAMTDVIMLIADPDVDAIIQKWGGYVPTVANVVYNAVANTFEVYGGNTAYCGDDWLTSGYTKLTGVQSGSDFTFSGEYQYYVVYTPPFSKVTVDAITPSSGTYPSAGTTFCARGKISGYTMGSKGDGLTVTLGGAQFNGSAWLVQANPGATTVTVSTVGTAVAQKPAVLSKAARSSSAATTLASNEDIVTQFNSLLNKLPKNKPTFFQKVSRAVASAIPAGAPTVSEMQAVLDNKVLPVINGAIAKVRTVQGSGYTFTITPAMTGNVQTVNTVLDDGEFYAFDALLSGAGSVLNLLTAYNLDVDYSTFEADPLSVFSNASFFTLKSTGSAKMSAAYAGLRDAAEKSKSAYNFVFNQWEYTQSITAPCGFKYLYPKVNVTDNGIKLHSTGYQWNTCDPYRFTVENDTSTRRVFDIAKMVLSAQTTFTETVLNSQRTQSWAAAGFTTIIVPAQWTSDSNRTETTIFDASKFFTAPLDRTDLPTMAYDLPIDLTLSQSYKQPVNSLPNGFPVYSNVDFTSDIPDKTLNGILPNGIPGIDAIIYLDKAVLLDPSTRSGFGEGRMASDGTSVYLYKQQYPGSPNATIWKIDPSTGGITATYPLNLSSLANKISWINSITWHNGALWATGGYGTGTYWLPGLFQLDLATSSALNTEPSPTFPCPWNAAQTCNPNAGGLASDGTNFYLSMGFWNSPGYSGVYQWAPGQPKPTAPLYVMNYAPWDIAFGNGYLWVKDDTFDMVDPNTRAVVKRYAGNSSSLYFNNRLWTISYDRLTSYVAP